MIAQLDGNIDHSPRDPSLKPGNDGTLRPNNHGPAYVCEYTVPEEILPLTIQDMEIDALGVIYSSEAILDGSKDPESLFINMHESSGLLHSFALRRTIGTITASKEIELDLGDDQDREVSASDPGLSSLSESTKLAILDDLMDGKHHILLEEGPEGDFARASHVLMLPAPELSPDDFELLHAIYDVLRRTTSGS